MIKPKYGHMSQRTDVYWHMCQISAAAKLLYTDYKFSVKRAVSIAYEYFDKKINGVRIKGSGDMQRDVISALTTYVKLPDANSPVDESLKEWMKETSNTLKLVCHMKNAGFTTDEAWDIRDGMEIGLIHSSVIDHFVRLKEPKTKTKTVVSKA